MSKRANTLANRQAETFTLELKQLLKDKFEKQVSEQQYIIKVREVVKKASNINYLNDEHKKTLQFWLCCKFKN